jgi:hypothetical protein
MFAATTERPAPIYPEALYPRRAFMGAAGISEQRLYQAKQRGITLPTLNVGRRVFVRGADGIRFIERLADASK